MGEQDKSDFDILNDEYEEYTDTVNNFIEYESETWNFDKINDLNSKRINLNNRIDSKKQLLNYDIGHDIDELNETYTHVKTLHDDYLEKNEKLKSVISNYNTKVAVMNNSSNGSSYLTLVMGIIVLLLLFSIVIMNIIEDKKEMNTVSRILFFVILLYIFKTISQYLSGYIQRKL